MPCQLEDRIMPVRRGWTAAGNGHRSRVRRALIALAAVLVVATVVLVAACTTVPAPPAVTAQTADASTAPSNWKLAFSTDFPGTSLDTSTWARCYPWSPKPPGCTNFGNSDEAEWYLPP